MWVKNMVFYMKKYSKEFRVTIIVCGTFHFRQYINSLSKVLPGGTYFFSGKYSCKRPSFNGWRFINFFPKEYLVHLIYRYFPSMSLKRVKRLIHQMWQLYVIYRLRESDVFHILIHGNTDKIMRSIKRKYPRAVIIGEAVNSHPDTFLKLLNEARLEYDLEALEDIEMGRDRMIREIDSIDYLLTGSGFIAESYELNGFDSSRVKILEYSTSLDVFKRLARSPNPEALGLSVECDYRILYVGHISPRKGIKYLLEAVEQLKRYRIELILIGRLDSEVNKIFSDYSLRYVHLSGLSHNQLVDYYNVADITVLPSIEDGFGYVIKESLACGTPVVCTSNCGGKDLIEQGINGLIVPPFSSAELRKAFLTLIENPLEIEDKNAPFSWNDYANNLVDYYHDVTQS